MWRDTRASCKREEKVRWMSVVSAPIRYEKVINKRGIQPKHIELIDRMSVERCCQKHCDNGALNTMKMRACVCVSIWYATIQCIVHSTLAQTNAIEDKVLFSFGSNSEKPNSQRMVSESEKSCVTWISQHCCVNGQFTAHTHSWMQFSVSRVKMCISSNWN